VGAVAAVFVYREVVESPYTRLNQSEVETDSFENLKRVSTVELLRRRADSDIGKFFPSFPFAYLWLLTFFIVSGLC